MTRVGGEERALRRYRRLCRMLPRDFRTDWAADMEDLFLHRLRQAGGGWRGLGVWLRGTWDVMNEAVWLRLQTIHRERGGGDMGRDVREAVRSLAAARWFTFTAVLTLALGIGAAVTTFSVVHAVLLRDLPYQDPDRLVVVWPDANFNVAMVEEIRSHVPAISDISGVSMWALTLAEGERPRELSAARVSPQHFTVLGVDPLLGRGFRPEEGLPGRDDVAVLSYDLWVSAFGSDPGVIGRRIELTGADHLRREIVGVMPRAFRPIDGAPDLWIPLTTAMGATAVSDSTWYVNVKVARLAPDVNAEVASAQLREFASRAWVHPNVMNEEEARAAHVAGLSRHVAGKVATPLWVALGAVGLVLLMACANVANLMLARGEGRATALAVRAALGARGSDLVRFLMTESVLVAVTGGALGVVLARGLLEVVVAWAPADFPRVDEIGLNAPVVAFALVATGFAAVVAGLLPALRHARVKATGALGRSARGAAGRSVSTLTRSLVAAQVALGVVVATAAGLMLRSLDRMLSEDTGIQAEGVLTFRVAPGEGRYVDAAAYADLYRRLLERLRAVPEVESASAIHLLPGTLSNWSFPTFPEGVVHPEGVRIPSMNFRLVWPEYFQTVGVPLLQGRDVAPSDGAADEAVVVVNQAYVDRWWPGEDPLGRTIRIFSSTAEPRRVIGVVGNVRQFGPRSAPVPEIYIPQTQWSWRVSQTLVVRFANGDPLAGTELVRQAVADVDAAIPVTQVEALASVLTSTTRTSSFLTLLLALFGGLAVSLGAVGVFGVNAHTVGRRRGEFGVRIALGSTRASVVRTAVAGALPPVAVGVLVGVAGAWAASGVLESVLYEVTPTDPVTYGGVALLLLVVAVLSSLIPAWRAGRVDPVTVLNAD